MHRIAQGDLHVNRSPVQLYSQAHKLGISSAPSSSGQVAIHEANARLLARRKQQSKTNSGWLQPLHNGLQQPQQTPPAQLHKKSTTPQTIKLHSALAIAVLQAQQETAARIWLLSRVLDSKGQGWLSIEELRTKLTSKESNLHVCGWRRLRQILQQGKGIFWERDDANRLWLKSAEKVAHALNVQKLSGSPVRLSVANLTSNIRIVRANLYATFHSNRQPAPISRQTLATVTGIPERTQRDYDRLCNTKVTSNIALGGAFSAENLQTEMYARPGVFQFIDKQGKQGEANQRYLAWRLPNSYQPVHDAATRGRQRKINRWLHSRTDLVTNRAQGNSVDKCKQRTFFDPTVQRTTKSENSRETYWRDPLTKLWHQRGIKNKPN